MPVEPTEPDDSERFDIRSFDGRAGMGLPESFVERLTPESLRTHEDLRDLDRERLAMAAEAADASFSRRWLASSLLGLVGDPRIDTFDPRMCDMRGGRALIGLPEEEVERVARTWAHRGVRAPWIRKEVPRHEVRLAPFRIMKYPVTNEDWLRFCRAHTDAPAPTSWRFGVYPLARPNHPVWTVPVAGAEMYADWLRARTSRAFGLPSEAQWEYAATGGDGREFPWGHEWDESKTNTAEAGPLTTTPVGIYPTGSSPGGVLDLAGNVEEYVMDRYEPYPGGTWISDELTRDNGGPYRVTRGGSFSRFGDLARCSRRHGPYNGEIYAIGFRLVEEFAGRAGQ